ncbi:hypothetical protein ABTD77_19750, partial [Acinetobacter baumannii]
MAWIDARVLRLCARSEAGTPAEGAPRSVSRQAGGRPRFGVQNTRMPKPGIRVSWTLNGVSGA